MRDQITLNKQLAKFAKDLFQLWDEKGYGKTKLQTIVKNFISLGFATSEEIISSFFTGIVQRYYGKTYCSQEEYRNCEIGVAEFVNLFKGDEYQQKILNGLNQTVRQKNHIIDE